MYRFKRFNRGIALALALLIGLIVYVSIDQKSFDKESGTIKAFIESYFDEAEAFCVTPESLRSISENLPKSELVRVSDAYKKLFDKYWEASDQQSGSYFAANLSYMRQRTDNSMASFKGYITKADISIKKVKSLKKIAPQTAMFSAEVSSAYEYAGRPEIPDPVWGSMYYSYGGDQSEISNEIKGTESRGDVDFVLKRTDGQWKICQILQTGGQMVRDFTAEVDSEGVKAS